MTIENSILLKKITCLKHSTGPDVFLFKVSIENKEPPESLMSFLGKNEMKRAQNFTNPSLRHKYIWCHGLLKYIIFQTTGLNFYGIDPTLSPYGRPSFCQSSFDFNLSHSDDVALIGLFLGNGSIGVDIEKMRVFDYENISKLCFSAKERQEDKNSNHSPQFSFFRRWTCKEAILKAIGTGLIEDMTSLELSYTLSEHPVISFTNFEENDISCHTHEIDQNTRISYALINTTS